jgi:protein-L-isoaspartate(D-aspartate) O-methyltransferase
VSDGSGTSVAEFGIHAHGPHADALADAMADLVVAWDRDARNTSPRLQVHPADSPDGELPHGHILNKPHSRLLFTWTSRTRRSGASDLR